MNKKKPKDTSHLPPLTDKDFRTVGWRQNPNGVADAVNAMKIGPLLLHREHVETTIGNGIKFLKNVSEKLVATDLAAGYCEACKRSGPTTESLGKTFSYVAKTIDEVHRLMEFAAGRADSRHEVVGLADLLQYLTNEQFQQVQAWIDEGKAKRAAIDVTP